jgi:hypothetical protein
MKTRAPSTFDISAAVAGAIACALLVTLGLRAAATPTDARERLVALNGQVDEAARLLGQPSPGGAIDATCGGADSGISRVRSALTAVANKAGVSQATIDVRAAPADGNVTPLIVHFEATGDYSGVIHALSDMTVIKPTLLVDTVDITAHTSTATLSLTGRSFCSAPI